MAHRQRNYPAEYARRINRLIPLGYTRAQARGHPRPAEPSVRSIVRGERRATLGMAARRARISLVPATGMTPPGTIQVVYTTRAGERRSFYYRVPEGQDPSTISLTLAEIADLVNRDYPTGGYTLLDIKRRSPRTGTRVYSTTLLRAGRYPPGYYPHAK